MIQKRKTNIGLYCFNKNGGTVSQNHQTLLKENCTPSFNRFKEKLCWA